MLFVLAGLTLASLAVAVATLVLCLRLITADRERHATQVADLLQRIQAPEVAVMTHATPDEQLPTPSVAMDDDAAHWEARGQHVSKEQIAEFAYAAELA